MVTLAPGNKAPEGSLIVPRSEGVASWPNEGATVERIQRSIHPRRDFFTAKPPKSSCCVVLGSDPFLLFARMDQSRSRRGRVIYAFTLVRIKRVTRASESLHCSAPEQCGQLAPGSGILLNLFGLWAKIQSRK